MNVIRKIAILISWPRELDMFSVLLERSSNDVVIIVDDFYYAADERSGNAKDIVDLVDGKFDYVFLSKLLGRSKYKILISTGQAIQEKITITSYLKYVYGITMGRFIQFVRLSGFFKNKIGRPMTGGGVFAEKFGKYRVEKKIGEKIIRYPKGLDISTLRFPDKQWKNIFDVYLCHSSLDQRLISEAFPDSMCINIGYPRYDSAPTIAEAKNIIYKDIKNIDTTKPILLWMPTLIKMKGEIIDNIEVWIPTMKKMLDRYNVVIRLHPKLVVIDPKLAKYLKEVGLIVDTTKGRNLSILYQSSDLVMADYGGSVLSAVYMKKKLILLNAPSGKYNRWRRKRKYTDFYIRKNVSTFNINQGLKLIEKIDKDIHDDNLYMRNKLKERYFGSDNSHKDIKKVFYKLKKELHN